MAARNEQGPWDPALGRAGRQAEHPGSKPRSAPGDHRGLRGPVFWGREGPGFVQPRDPGGLPRGREAELALKDRRRGGGLGAPFFPNVASG